MSKKYLVTGAAGFIASKVCQKLLDQGNEVVGVDNLNDYYDVRLKKWLRTIKWIFKLQKLYICGVGYRRTAKT